jgi:hypothetical protein
MFAQYVTAVVMGTGWTLTGNRIAWGNAAMSALVWYGDNRTYGAIANHGTISGNFFHTSGAPRCLAFADRGMHCDTSSGANVRKFCTVATEVADCGGATRCVADSGYTGNVAITGNTFFNCVSSTGDFIDMDGAGLTSESAAIGSVTISGNQFTDSASTQTLITFDPALPSKYGNITIGGNGWTRTAGAYVENWDTAMGVWHDLPRMMCVAVDNVSSSTLRPFWAAPDTGAEVWALKCNHFDTCGTVPHVRLEDQSANQIGSGGSLVCDSGTSATWLAFTSARQVQAREVVYLKVTNSPTATCDVLVCAQYDG